MNSLASLTGQISPGAASQALGPQFDTANQRSCVNKPSEVQNWIDYNRMQHRKLDELLDKLNACLSPVLSEKAQPEDPQPPCDLPPPSTPLSAQVAELCLANKSHHDRLTYVIARLAI